MRMRTNIELDDDLLAEAARFSPARGKRAIVREALSLYVTAKREEECRTTYRERLQRIRAKVASLRIKADAHDLVRRDRERR
jgi:Arc/MetJ family transcription regulator